ncbi:cytochrome P450 94A2-like [Pistacia vera]|uniref:cytochrome P450 94A2-like n=1 Tax=Pistacia vera TaxID=55513 RepID=UPI001263399C|nr:cytochrome P450 94A2-like [Pistacia vera]XP_031265117.1 cytochrome P450 94A2-like [Pistacia vera]
MELFSLQSLLFFSLLSLFFYFFASPKQTLNGFKRYPLFGCLPGFIINDHRLLEWTTQKLKNYPTNTAVIYNPGTVHGVLTANPSNVEYILKTNFENYQKGDVFIAPLEDLLGRGIFNSDGELWKVQRKTASHQFNTKSLRSFVVENVKFETCARLVPMLTKASEREEVLDLQGVLEKFAFDNICKVVFNVDPGCLGGDGAGVGAEFMRAFEDASNRSCGRFRYAFEFLWRLKKFYNIGSERELKKSIAIVNEFSTDIIRSRLEAKKENENDQDLLSHFIGSNYNPCMNSPELYRDMVINFILAGHDSTSSALSWFFWLLSSHPDVEENILKELESIRTKNQKIIGQSYEFDELREMHYLHAALSESLRLYPPVPLDSKVCCNDDKLPDGTFVGKGWIISYHAYAMGRMEGIWGKNCHEFLPERWLENGMFRQENAYRFPVFHAGPRMCIGKDMAYIQMKSIVASVIERFIVDVQDKNKSPEYVLSMTLRMKNGLKVKVRKRSQDFIN